MSEQLDDFEFFFGKGNELGGGGGGGQHEESEVPY